jgi:hypothetical protein
MFIPNSQLSTHVNKEGRNQDRARIMALISGVCGESGGGVLGEQKGGKRERGKELSGLHKCPKLFLCTKQKAGAIQSLTLRARQRRAAKAW